MRADHIADLKRVLTRTNEPQIQQVFTHLMQGSQNHLRAFASQLSRQGVNYKAEFLTQAEFDQISNSMEKGMVRAPVGLWQINVAMVCKRVASRSVLSIRKTAVRDLVRHIAVAKAMRVKAMLLVTAFQGAWASTV